ncbi:hypothetical protein [Nocardia sp. NPDC059239]|uniref:hypothetical protein n=1 Tax=Nocardia sp. NPDC059239 TaxID=3346785 RepID=UPI0036BED868
MTVGSMANLPLQGSQATSGAVFLLRKPPVQSVTIELDGWTVSLQKGINAVVTYGGTAFSHSECHAAALIAANNGLDYLSARGACDVAIHDSHDDCLTWWHEQSGIVMRINAVTTMTSHSNAVVEARRADGTTVAQTPVFNPVQHDVLRFIRMSRTSEYLYDSYRNMFLALEALLYDIRPKQQKANGNYEGDNEWFEKALREADRRVPIAPIAPAGVPSPVKWVINNIYNNERSGLMHAKHGYHLPQDDKSREQLEASLGVLWSYVRELVENHLGIANMSGGLVHSGWKLMMERFLPALRVVVSDDSTPISSDNQPFAPVTGSVVELPSGPVVMTEGFVGTILGSCPRSALTGFPQIYRIGAMDSDGNAIAFSPIPGPLKVGTSISRFEVLLGCRNVNADGPRTHFSA